MTGRLLHVSDLEYAFDDPERVGRLAGRIAQRRDGSSLLVDTGDALGPSVLGLYAEGRQALTFHEHVQPDVGVVGNHELDHGVDAFRRIVEASPMPWLAANLEVTDGADGGDLGVEPWVVRDVDDATVGLVGVTTPMLADVAPGAGLSVSDPVSAVESAMDALRERAVDRVVVCSHAGDADDAIAARTDADVVLGGHVHEERIERVEGTLLVRPGNGGHGVAEVHLRREPTAFRLSVDDAPVDESVVAALRAHETGAGLDDVVATVGEPVPVHRAADLEGESRIGNFVTDAFRWATGADVAVLPAGGIRTGDPLVGDLTVADLAGLTPFDEVVCVAAVTGAQLRSLVGDLALAQYPAAPASHFGHVSGMSVEWNDDADEAASVTVDGGAVADDETYSVALSRFFVESDHSVEAVGAGDVRAEHGPEHEAVVEYARSEGVHPELEGRIRRV